MANHKSAAKRARQSEKIATRNLSIKRSVRTFEKKLLQAITKKEAEPANTALKEYMSKMDKASKRGVFHAKTAARKVSRLSTRVAQLNK